MIDAGGEQGDVVADTDRPPDGLTLVVGDPGMLTEQYDRRRWVSFVSIRHAATASEDGVQMVEPTRKAELTPAQRRAANRLVTESRAAAERRGWFDYDTGVAGGFHRMAGISDHWVNDESATNGRILDPERLEFLMFHEVGGPLTIWHYRLMPPACYEHGIVVTDADSEGACTAGRASGKSSEMLHVWCIDRVDGPFASDMTPPGGGGGGHMHHHHK